MHFYAFKICSQTGKSLETPTTLKTLTNLFLPVQDHISSWSTWSYTQRPHCRPSPELLSWERDCPVTEKSHKLHIKEGGWSFLFSLFAGIYVTLSQTPLTQLNSCCFLTAVTSLEDTQMAISAASIHQGLSELPKTLPHFLWILSTKDQGQHYYAAFSTI